MATYMDTYRAVVTAGLIPYPPLLFKKLVYKK
jgi:hypothetical protein